MKLPRFVTLIGTVLLILFLMQIYAFESLVRTIDSFHIAAFRNWIIGILIFFLVLLDASIILRLFFRMIYRSDSKFVRRILVIPGSVWTVSSILFFFFALIKDFGLWLWGFIPHANDQAAQIAGGLSIGVPLILTGYGVFKTARDYDVKKIDLQFPNLPSAFDGFQIAQISDIHSGIFMNEREMREILEIINSLHPQVAALTGDFVDTRAVEIEPVAKVFSQIKTDFGIYGCMGNHDVFDNYPKLSAAMQQAGIVMLDNQHRKVKMNGDSISLLGVGDAGRRYSHARLEQALQGVDPDSLKILLAHRPSFFHASVNAGIDLQLSGHTHGGQIGLNIGRLRLNPVYLFEKYVQGLYVSGKSKLYVNPGVGMVFAPMRLSVRPEITLITLRSA